VGFEQEMREKQNRKAVYAVLAFGVIAVVAMFVAYKMAN
jgi:hypothetical protein